MRNFKEIIGVLSVTLLCGCVKSGVSEYYTANESDVYGALTVSVKDESVKVKSLAEYESAISEESAVYKVDVLVFDQETKLLERSASISSLDDRCSFELPVGQKLVYAVVNGPDIARVQNLDGTLELTEDLSTRNYLRDGFVMVGYESCAVTPGGISKPEIVVKRLVSRVELRSIKCNVPVQYESMRVESVFLGNAHSVQSLSGAVSSVVNSGGYADVEKTQAIGRDDVVGACGTYMYREPGVMLQVGETSSEPVYMYCQPDSDEVLTSLYLLVTIGEGRYYYRVPLDKGLAANTTCVVDAVITNLGTTDPYDGVVQKGEIQATVTVVGWNNDGKVYHTEF